MGSALPTLQPKQPEAQTFGLVLNPIPQIHPLILLQCSLSLRLKLAWCSYLYSEPQHILTLQHSYAGGSSKSRSKCVHTDLKALGHPEEAGDVLAISLAQ